MALAQDIVTRASRRINILAGEEALTAAEMVDSLEIMNDMMAGFYAQGIEYVHVTLAQTDTVNMPDQLLRDLTLMLCSELADGFGLTLGPKIAADIAAAKLELQSFYMVINPAVPDRAIRRRRLGWYSWGNGQ